MDNEFDMIDLTPTIKNNDEIITELRDAINKNVPELSDDKKQILEQKLNEAIKIIDDFNV